MIVQKLSVNASIREVLVGVIEILSLLQVVTEFRITHSRRMIYLKNESAETSRRVSVYFSRGRLATKRCLTSYAQRGRVQKSVTAVCVKSDYGPCAKKVLVA